MNILQFHRHKKYWIAGLLSALFLLGLLAAGVSAQTPYPSDDEINAIAREMYCPVCENIPLDVCPTQACAQWRDLIAEKLAAGWNEEQIKEYFVAQYGERVLDVPRMQGFNLLLVGLIGLSAAVALGVFVWVLRNTRRKAISAPAAVEEISSTPDDPYLAQVERELRERQKKESK